MQVMLILGILSAIGAVFFALQNTASVVVNLALWQFEGSLAVALLVALGLGVLITGLLSSPSVIRRQWENARLRRQVESLERGPLLVREQAIAEVVVRPGVGHALTSRRRERPWAPATRA